MSYLLTALHWDTCITQISPQDFDVAGHIWHRHCRIQTTETQIRISFPYDQAFAIYLKNKLNCKLKSSPVLRLTITSMWVKSWLWIKQHKLCLEVIWSKVHVPYIHCIHTPGDMHTVGGEVPLDAHPCGRDTSVQFCLRPTLSDLWDDPIIILWWRRQEQQQH